MNVNDVLLILYRCVNDDNIEEHGKLIVWIQMNCNKRYWKIRNSK